jgi:hypothetical protein
MKKFIHVKCYFLFLLFVSLVACENTAKQSNKTDEKANNTNADTAKPTAIVKAEPVQNLSAHFYKRLAGKIDSKPIVMHLIRTDSLLRGSFFYKNAKNTFFNEESTIDRKGTIKIAAYNENNDNDIKLAGMFEGIFENTVQLKGVWKDNESGQNLKFSLEEKYKEGSMPLMVTHFYKQLDCDEEKACATMTLNFPRLKKEANPKLANIINAEINKNLLEMLSDLASNPDEAKASSIEEATAAFFDSFGEDGEQYGQRWSNEIDWDIHNNAHHVLSFALNKYYYTGGAHPNYMSQNFNFNLNNGKLIQLSDIFEGDYKKILLQAAEKELRKQQDIPAKAPLSDFIFEDELTLNDDFYLSPEGITFVYDPYEIAPYAFGTITLPIAFKDIKSIVKKDGLLAKMVK